MSGSTYVAFSCPKCKSVSGDIFIRDMLMEKGYEEPFRKVSLPVGECGLPRPHWCLDTSPPYESGAPDDQGGRKSVELLEYTCSLGRGNLAAHVYVLGQGRLSKSELIGN